METAQITLSRPTNKFSEVISFYKDGMGMQILGGFDNRNGFDGLYLGFPESHYFLEVTTNKNKESITLNEKSDYLVFYVSDLNKLSLMELKLNVLGYFSIKVSDTYWANKGVVFEDPDGWKIVLVVKEKSKSVNKLRTKN